MTEENSDEETPQALDLTVLELDQIRRIFISLLAAKAWQHMGIRLTPGKEETEKDLVKAAADAATDVKDAVETTQRQTSGLTTLVYGAIGASLIAALAAIVSLMQISRRIAG